MGSPATCSRWNGNRWISTSRPATSTLCCWSVITPTVIRCWVLCGLGSRSTLRIAMSCRRVTRRQLRGALTRKDVSWNAIVVVCPPRPVDEALPDSEQLALAQSRTLLIADIVKTLSQIGARNSPRLWIVTRGAQQLDAGDGVTLAQTTLRGIARVLTFEHPELKTTIVDVDADGDRSATALIDELLAGPDHDEVALRDGQRYVNRLVRVPTSVDGVLAVEPRRTVVDLGGAGAVRLQIDQPGRLDALSVHAVKRIPPQDDQVEVRVVAAGLNFSRRAQGHGRLSHAGR